MKYQKDEKYLLKTQGGIIQIHTAHESTDSALIRMVIFRNFPLDPLLHMTFCFHGNLSGSQLCFALNVFQPSVCDCIYSLI